MMKHDALTLVNKTKKRKEKGGGKRNAFIAMGSRFVVFKREHIAVMLGVLIVCTAHSSNSEAQPPITPRRDLSVTIAL